MPAGASKVKECENLAQSTMDTTSLKGRQVIQSDLDVLRSDWEDYTNKLSSLKESLEQALRYWNMYDSNYQQHADWLKACEKQIKDCPLKSTLEEKRELLSKYQHLLIYFEDMDNMFRDERVRFNHLQRSWCIGL
uniref:Uncharacterized protein n=1 Tax=Biomphalaria glabrata TaxID=6526 RepID=A0A2C9KC45_BIOGL